MSKNKKHKEFNIPIKLFGNKHIPAITSPKENFAETAQNITLEDSMTQEGNNEIVPIMLKNDSENLEKNPIEADSTQKKRGRFNAPMPWVEKKTKGEKIKLMWAIVGSFMAVILFVWAIFLKYNIMLEKLSLKQMEKEEEWDEVKENFEKSMDDFQKMLSEVKNGAIQSQPAGETSATPKTNQTDSQIEKNATINNLTEENIEKLKEKLLKKSN